jgi:hypothetical protein
LIVFLQVILSLFLIIAVYRNRPVLNDSKRWRFLAARPFSVGLFFGAIVAILLFEYRGVPETWKFLNLIVVGVSFARLLGALNETSWKRQFVSGLIIVLIVTRLMYVISGLILLFERPVRVGDFIELGGKWGEIKNIGLRATTVQTLDQADVIIPNADLVANQVINWTLSSRRVRLIIPVGIAYGSDISLVMETLMACAIGSSKVAKTPEPQVLYLSFGESTLDFELRVWVPNAEERLTVISELHQEIDRRFREAKIEIAFPQRDLHLRSVDESAIFQPTEAAK